MNILAKGSLLRKQFVLMSGDIIVSMAVITFAESIGLQNDSPQMLLGYSDFFFILVLILSSYFCEIYNIRRWVFKKSFIRTFMAAFITYLIFILLSIFFGYSWHIVIVISLFFMFQILWQGLYNKIIHSSYFSKNVVVIGTGTNALEINKIINAFPGKYNFSGYISTPADQIDVDKKKIIGKTDDIIEICKQYKVYAIILALTERRGNLTINKLISCKLIGVRIIDYPNFYEAMTGKIPVESINPSWLVHSSGFLVTPFIRVMKRILDIIFSSLLLLITMPFFPLIVFLTKYESPGPIFYLQQRVGENGKNFTIYKFRTMKIDAEHETGAAWAMESDPRISKFGHLLRIIRIDELPQLINVFNGKMSFIGPRPERPEFVEQICKATPYYMERHAVKPGITGWAQVMYPYGASLGDSVEKLRYDLYYINNLSLFLELLIVFKTIKVILFRKGSR